MFDVGFSELLMVGLVGLLVVGPHRLPKMAHGVGLWLGKAKRLSAAVKAEIQHELAIEESRQLMRRALDDSETVAEEIDSAMAAFGNKSATEIENYPRN